MGHHPRASAAAAAGLLRLWPWLFFLRQVAGNEKCWTGDVTHEKCCDARFGPQGNPGCWDAVFTYEFCCFDPTVLPTPPALLAGSSAEGYPGCAVSGVVLRHVGEHAIFEDMSTHGASGCFQNNCKRTDKFNSKDRGVCARLCAELEECTHWSFGMQDGSQKCFLRKSDEGRQAAPPGWVSGAKACAPAALPHGFTALAVAESKGLTDCDGGKSERCPDVMAAINTWIFAIDHLKKAAVGRVDEGTMEHIDAIGRDSRNMANQINAEYRPSDADFPRVVYNNRLIFNTLADWLQSFRKVDLNSSDGSLPVPLRSGMLCGQTSCYES